MSQLETNGPDCEPNAGLVGLSGLLSSVISAGRDILARRRQNALEAPSSDLLEKSKQLIHHRGEASGLALACEVVATIFCHRRLFPLKLHGAMPENHEEQFLLYFCIFLSTLEVLDKKHVNLTRAWIFLIFPRGIDAKTRIFL